MYVSSCSTPSFSSPSFSSPANSSLANSAIPLESMQDRMWFIIGNDIRAFDWYRSQWPWIILNCVMTFCASYLCGSSDYCSVLELSVYVSAWSTRFFSRRLKFQRTNQCEYFTHFVRHCPVLHVQSTPSTELAVMRRVVDGTVYMWAN